MGAHTLSKGAYEAPCNKVVDLELALVEAKQMLLNVTPTSNPAASTGSGLFGANDFGQPQHSSPRPRSGNSNQAYGALGGGLFGNSDQSYGAPSGGSFGQSNQGHQGPGGALFGESDTMMMLRASMKDRWSPVS